MLVYPIACFYYPLKEVIRLSFEVMIFFSMIEIQVRNRCDTSNTKEVVDESLNIFLAV